MWRLSAAAFVVMSFLMVGCGLGTARDDGSPAGDGIAADGNASGDDGEDGDEDKG